MAASLFLDLDGMPIPDSEVIGYGGSGVVLRRDNLAIKIPLRHPWSSEAEVQSNIKILQHEQEAYRRLNASDMIDRIVPCIRLSTNATQLAFMENGDVRAYLESKNKNPPPRTLQISWFRQMARALEQVHDNCVLVADIATRNFLLDSDLSVKICDFSEASILPLGTAMATADDDDGFSVQTDIGLLGAVMYEVITGQKCDFDLFQDDSADNTRASLPRRSSLPSTETLWLGSIIDKCWTAGGFQDAHALSQALNSFDLELEQESRPFNSSFQYQVIMLAMAFTTLAIVATWARRQP